MTQGLPPFPSTLRRIFTVTALTALLPACSSPLTPTRLTSVLEQQGATASASTPFVTERRMVASYELVSGVFTITFRTADGSVGTISGTYTGLAIVGPGNTMASLNLLISETTGAGSLVTGLEATGAGAFGGAGDFTLSLKLASSSKVLDGSKVMFRGTSQISCNASGQVVVTQSATDVTSRFAEINIELRHVVGNAGCSP